MRPVVMCGIPRSGSTLVWQILSEVLDQDIPKTHPGDWDPDGVSLAVVTIRDPRDVAASLYRVRISRGGPEVGGPEGLDNVLRQLQMYFRSVPKVLKGPHILLRYEELFENIDLIWGVFLGEFGVRIPCTEQSRIEEKFSLQANRERAACLKDFNEFDEYRIHGDHIGPAVPGSWRRSLPEWAHGCVEKVCGPIAREWDYV